MAKLIFNAVLVGTQYGPEAAGARYVSGQGIGITIVQPAATTVTWTLQCSNMSEDDIIAGVDDWCDYYQRDGVTLMSFALTGGEKRYFELIDFPFVRYRLKAVTTGTPGTTGKARANHMR